MDKLSNIFPESYVAGLFGIKSETVFQKEINYFSPSGQISFSIQQDRREFPEASKQTIIRPFYKKKSIVSLSSL